MVYSARVIANYLIREKEIKDGVPPTPMQLLKLVYIAHGWNLAINNRPLIRDRIEAWRYGPVVPNLYHDLKQWGNTPVEQPLPVPVSGTGNLSPEEREIVDEVLNAYGDLSGMQLSNLTHASDTPWHQVYFEEGGQDTDHAPIANDLIKQHFMDLASRNAHDG